MNYAFTVWLSPSVSILCWVCVDTNCGKTDSVSILWKIGVEIGTAVFSILCCSRWVFNIGWQMLQVLLQKLTGIVLLPCFEIRLIMKRFLKIFFNLLASISEISIWSSIIMTRLRAAPMATIVLFGVSPLGKSKVASNKFANDWFFPYESCFISAMNMNRVSRGDGGNHQHLHVREYDLWVEWGRKTTTSFIHFTKLLEIFYRNLAQICISQLRLFCPEFYDHDLKVKGHREIKGKINLYCYVSVNLEVIEKM